MSNNRVDDIMRAAIDANKTRHPASDKPLNLEGLLREPVEIRQLSPDEVYAAWLDSEGDIYIDPHGDAYYCGQLIVQGIAGEPHPLAIYHWMNLNCYWPNIWEINDHGNAALMVLHEGELVMVGGLV